MPLKRLGILFLLIAISAPLWSSLSAAPAELLVNGGFESGVSSWQTYGGQLSRVASPVYAGNFSAAYTSADFKAKWFYQDVPVSAGGVYSFSGWALKNNPNISEVKLRISWYSQSTGYGNSQASGAEISSITSAALSSDSATYRYLSTGQVEAPYKAIIARLKVLLVPISRSSATIYFDGFNFTGQGPASPITPVSPASGDSTGNDSSDSPDPSPVIHMSPTQVPSPAPTPFPTITPNSTPTATPIIKAQPTNTPTPTARPTPTPSPTRTPTLTPTRSPTPTRTPTPRPTPSPVSTSALSNTPLPVVALSTPAGVPLPVSTHSSPTPISTPIVPTPLSTPSDSPLQDSGTQGFGGGSPGIGLANQKSVTPTSPPLNPTPLLNMPISVPVSVSRLSTKPPAASATPSNNPNFQKDPYPSPDTDEVTLSETYPVDTAPPQPPSSDSGGSVAGLTVALVSLGAASAALSLWLRKWV